MNQKNFSISFCIVCLNNLPELRETLLKNIKENIDYLESEFVVLDCDSKDGTDVWLKEEMGFYLSTGKISYYKIIESLTPWSSCLKNLAAKLANGDIICFLYPNNYTGVDFAAYINETFNKNTEIVLVSSPPYPATDISDHPGISIKLSISKSNFLKFNGFDELIDKAGFEDWDLLSRLRLTKIKQINIMDLAIPKYTSGNHAISLNDMYQVFASYISPTQSELILLHQDGHYKNGLITNNSVLESGDYRNACKSELANPLYSIETASWSNGLWKETTNDSILFSPRKGKEYIFLRGHYPYDILFDVDRDMIFLHVPESEIIQNLFLEDQLFYSRSVIEQNRKEKRIIANPNGFGQCNVLRYFDSYFQV